MTCKNYQIPILVSIPSLEKMMKWSLLHHHSLLCFSSTATKIRKWITYSYFHTERPRSRSRSANPTSTTRERSSSRNSTGSRKPHLARGDSYKSTHEEEPSKYELPADLAQEVDEAKKKKNQMKDVQDNRNQLWVNLLLLLKPKPKH